MSRLILLLLATWLGCAPALAATPASGASATSATTLGDPWIDRALRDIDRYAARYPDAFADELVRYLDAPPALVAELLAQRQLAPHDLYAGCALAHVAGQPCRAVIADWRQAGDPGWGATARRLGVIPGSVPLARLRAAVVASYTHWDRPLAAIEAGSEDSSGTPSKPDARPAGTRPR